MRKHTLSALAALALACGAPAMAQSSPSDINQFWTGCVISRQISPSGATVAIDRVCSAPDRTFTVFEGNQTGQRAVLDGSHGPTSLDYARLRFFGFLSDRAQGDGRTARLWVAESGPASAKAPYAYDLKLRVDQEAIVHMPSGYSLGLRMDPSNVPTSFEAALSMPTWRR